MRAEYCGLVFPPAFSSLRSPLFFSTDLFLPCFPVHLSTSGGSCGATSPPVPPALLPVWTGVFIQDMPMDASEVIFHLVPDSAFLQSLPLQWPSPRACLISLPGPSVFFGRSRPSDAFLAGYFSETVSSSKPPCTPGMWRAGVGAAFPATAPRGLGVGRAQLCPRKKLD